MRAIHFAKRRTFSHSTRACKHLAKNLLTRRHRHHDGDDGDDVDVTDVVEGGQIVDDLVHDVHVLDVVAHPEEVDDRMTSHSGLADRLGDLIFGPSFCRQRGHKT